MSIEEIKSRCDKATEGPWYWEQEKRHGAVNFLYSKKLDVHIAVLDNAGFDTYDFIAHSRTDIPYLLERVEQLEKERDKLEERLGI